MSPNRLDIELLSGTEYRGMLWQGARQQFFDLDMMILLHRDVTNLDETVSSILCDGRSEETGNLTKLGNVFIY